MLADYKWVINIFSRMEFEKWIIINIIVKTLRTHTEARDHFAAIDGLLGTGNGAAFNQFNNPVAEHLGMDAKVSFVNEIICQCLGNSPDAALDGTAVINEPCNILPYASQRFIRRGCRNLYNWFIMRDEHIDGIDVNKTVAHCARHKLVDLRYCIAGIGSGRFYYIDRNTEAAQAVYIRRGNTNQSKINRDSACLELLRNIGQKYRGVIADTFTQSARARCQR